MVTVRHTPLTAMLSPKFVPSKTVLAFIVILFCVIAWISPNSSIIPVNMAQLYHAIQTIVNICKDLLFYTKDLRKFAVNHVVGWHCYADKQETNR